MSGYERPQDLAFVEDAEDDGDGLLVYLAALPDGPLVVLNRTSALIWRQAQEDGDVVVQVAQLVRADPESIRAEVEEFLETLVAQRLLERRIALTVTS